MYAWMLLHTADNAPLGVDWRSRRSFALMPFATGRAFTQPRNCLGVGAGNDGGPLAARFSRGVPSLPTMPTDRFTLMRPPSAVSM